MEKYQLANVVFLLLLSLILFSPAHLKWWISSSQGIIDTSPGNLGGLLADWPEANCLSRTQYQEYHMNKSSTKSISPSPYLISRLRRYESLHRKCARSAKQFGLLLDPKTTGQYSSDPDCKFIISINYNGLGNRMLTIASAFIYALLTNRILLVDRTDLPGMFCEPFPDTSWFVPQNFPHDWLHRVSERPAYRFGKLIEEGQCNNSLSSSKFLYVHITHSSDVGDKRFFCQYEQEFLKGVPWIILRGDVYFVPNFYYMSEFREELDKLFPDPDTGFHYISRYLFHPSNAVWSKVLKYYRTHLAGSSPNLVGFQIRPFDTRAEVVNRFSDQVMDCWENNGLLPNETRNKATVLTVSLHQAFYTRLKELETRGVKVLMPSHDERQQTDNLEHDKKALMEIYLLSMCDVLVTSPRSTFGYVANGLGGLKPWMLRGYLDIRPVCYRLPSPEPCLLLTSDQKCNCGDEVPANVTSVLGHCMDDTIMNGFQIVGSLFNSSNI